MSWNQELHNKTGELANRFKQTATRLEQNKDPRVFFTHAHGYITQQIHRHIDLFTKPDPLMQLNELFASDYLRAVNQIPHGKWKDAFDLCNGLKKANETSIIVNIGYVFTGLEYCAACMAKVHITQDLKNALFKVKDIDPQDYGNTLILVQEGNLYAEV